MEQTITAAATYVQINRDDLETWIDKLPGSWERVQGKAGIYLIHINDFVAVKLSSTIGTKDEAMGRGNASMQLSLVSRITGRTLNKVAQGQARFNRTTNWRDTWAAGVQRFRDVYNKSSDFYNTIAQIENQDVYREEKLAEFDALIAEVPNLKGNPGFMAAREKLERGGILTERDMNIVSQYVEHERKEMEKNRDVPKTEPPKKNTDPRVVILRKLYVEVRGRDTWAEGFVKSIGEQLNMGRNLSPRQIAKVMEMLERHGLSTESFRL